MSYPLVYPIGLPISIDSATQDFYDTIEALPPGSNVLVSYEALYGNQAELAPQQIAVTQHLFNQEGIRIIDASFNGASAQIIVDTIVHPKIDMHGKQYGIDWVHIGYLIGGETAMASLAQDFLYPQKDAHGTPLSELPLLKEVKSMNDIDLFVCFAGAEFNWNLRQFSMPYDVPAVTGLLAMVLPDAETFKAAGFLLGTLNGLPGGAQYELLVNKPGNAISASDAISVTHVFLLALVWLANIAYLIQRSRGGNN